MSPKESPDEPMTRIAAALERPAPAGLSSPVPEGGHAFVWEPLHAGLLSVAAVASLPLGLLKGIDHARDTLLENTQRFAKGLPANNALLWGARGMGKSSLVKAVHAEVNRRGPDAHLLRLLRAAGRRFLLYCDDLSFDNDDTSYKSLKAALEGGIEGRPENALFYATSNRRHLMPRDVVENERSIAINPSEAVEEKVSLSDRFGLWLGFHNCGQDAYLAMIDGYAAHFGIDVGPDELHARALAWAAARGARSGRVAWQFMQDLAGELGKRLG
jgi:predicted AAA+ superfamily ATPase